MIFLKNKTDILNLKRLIINKSKMKLPYQILWTKRQWQWLTGIHTTYHCIRDQNVLVNHKKKVLSRPSGGICLQNKEYLDGCVIDIFSCIFSRDHTLYRPFTCDVGYWIHPVEQ